MKEKAPDSPGGRGESLQGSDTLSESKVFPPPPGPEEPRPTPPHAPGATGAGTHPPRDPCGTAGTCLRPLLGALDGWLSGGERPPRLAPCSALGRDCELHTRRGRPDLYGRARAEPEAPPSVDLALLPRHVGRRVAVRARIAGIQVGVGADGGAPVATCYLDPLTGSSSMVPAVCPGLGDYLAGVADVEGTVALLENPAARWRKIGRGEDATRQPTNPLVPPYLIYLADASPRPAALRDYIPTEEDRRGFRRVFGRLDTPEAILDYADRAIAPEITGRAFEKVLCLLVALAPVGLPVPGGERFAIKAALVGDGREAKDAIAAATLALCPIPAVAVNAELANQRGLVGAVVHDEATGQYMVSWGRLAEADLGLAHIRGVHGLGGEAVAQLREVLSEGRASIEKVVKASRDARARLIMTANPAEPTAFYRTRWGAVRGVTGADGLPLWPGEPDLTRVHLWAVFRRGDVPFHASDAAILGNGGGAKRGDPDPDLLRRKLADTWRGATVDPRALKRVSERLLQGLRDLRARSQRLPLAVTGREGPKVLLALTLAAAELRARVKEADGRRVLTPTLEDADLALRVAREMLARLDVEAAEKEEGEVEEMARKAGEALAAPEWARGMDGDTAKEDALGLLAAILARLWESHPIPVPSEDVAKAAGLSRVTLWRARSRGEELLLGHCGDFPALIAGQENVGLRLSKFGAAVARETNETIKRIEKGGAGSK